MRKHRYSRYRTTSSPAQRASDWLENSPAKKIAVVLGAFIAFVLSMATGGWTLYKVYSDYQIDKQPVRIQIDRRSPPQAADMLVQKEIVNFMGTRYKPFRQILPYIAIDFSVHNPTRKRSALSSCTLSIKFFNRDVKIQSSLFMDVLAPDFLNKEPVVNAEVDATTRVTGYFFFSDGLAGIEQLKDRTTVPISHQLHCRDQGNRLVSSILLEM